MVVAGMKYLLIILLLSSCAHKEPQWYEINKCLDEQTELYSDLCAEETNDYEEMIGADAHFAGVGCGVSAARICIWQVTGRAEFKPPLFPDWH